MLDINFYHIGKWTDNKGNFDDTFFNYVKSISPKNIEYLGYLNDNELYNFFKESKLIPYFFENILQILFSRV